MPETFGSRLKRAWNVFTNREVAETTYTDVGPGMSYRPDKGFFRLGSEKTIINSIYTRIAIDAAAIDVKHVRTDANGKYLSPIDSGLNNCLTLEANIDQTGRSLIQDIVLSMLSEGVVAVVPVDTDVRLSDSNAYDILSLRTGKITQWYPQNVRVELYNERSGRREEIMLPKNKIAIIENPFYAVMNEPNSTLQRLIRKLSLLDIVDEQSGAGKLDMIIQLPYVIKSEARRQQAEERRAEIERQLSGSKYGIAYADGTEKIVQLNRSLENNLMSQVEYLTSMLYGQLGITTAILDGTATDQVMLNYYNRTIEPILSAIVEEMNRKFLSKTARSQHQMVRFFRDPFKLIPVNQMADIADKFTRNEILSSNEVRQIVGMPPVDSPQADELRNKNLNAGEGQQFATTSGGEYVEDDGPREGEPIYEEPRR